MTKKRLLDLAFVVYFVLVIALTMLVAAYFDTYYTQHP